jgi:3-hydroxyisobutyrate dehydrogenase-like beta-hydroxyacid dehydrogenase
VSRVTVLGLGAMGAAIAAKLRTAGHELTVWNRTPGRDDGLVATGARRAETPADAVRGADAVVTMLTDPPALEQVLFGGEGAASAIGHDATLIEMSTVGPSAIASVAERVAPVNVLDAPVLGSVPSVETGSLVILAGGDREVFDRHADLLGVLGTAMYVGPSGSGAWLKLVNNAASIATLVALGELLAVTDRAGLEPGTVLDSLEAGPLASLIARWRPRLLDQDTSSNFRLALARKDLEIAFEEAARLDRQLTVDETAAARADEAVEAGLADEDFGAVVGFLRR